MARLKKFNKNENNKVKKFAFLGVLCLTIAVISATISYAVYQQEAEVQFINARVGNFKANDIELAIKLDGEEVDTPPSKDNYTVTVDCDNATGRWDTTEWAAVVGNITSGKVKCEVNFVTPQATLTSVTATSDKTSISLSYTASGIGTSTTCKYGTDTNYGSTIEGATNTSCNISSLNMDTTYYYQVCAKNATGEVCKDGNIKTKPNSDPISKVKVGDYISMTPTSKSYTPLSSVTGYTGTNSTLNPSELNLWRVIRKNDDGTVDVVSVYVSSKEVYFYGRAGYLNFVGGLNTIAAQYTDGVHVQSTRHIGYSNQIEKCTSLSPTACPTDTGFETDTNLVQTATGTLVGKNPSGTAKVYWLASRNGNSGSPTNYGGRYVNASGSVRHNTLANSDGNENSGSHAVRPIVTLKSTVEIESGIGTSSSPYKLI